MKKREKKQEVKEDKLLNKQKAMVPQDTDTDMSDEEDIRKIKPFISNAQKNLNQNQGDSVSFPFSLDNLGYS